MSEVFDKFTDATVYFVMGAASTLLFLIRLVMSLFGTGSDSDFDTSVDTGDGGDGHDTTGVFKLFSILSIMAFFMGAGWMGFIARVEWDLNGFISGVAALVFGSGTMLLASGLMYGVRRLNKEPRFDLQAAVGSTGRVYLHVPQRGKGQGQVQVTVDGRTRTVRATSTGPEIASFADVKIVSVEPDFSVVVEPRT